MNSTNGLIELLPHQKEFVFSPFDEVALFGGVGDGKTFGGIAKTLYLCDKFPGNVILVGRLTYDQLRDTTEKQLLEIVKKRNGGNLKHGPYVHSFTQKPDTLVLRNGSQILFRYAENDQAMVNLELGGFWLDQVEYIPESVYDHLLDRLRLWGKRADPKSRAAEMHKAHGYYPRHCAFVTGNPAPSWVHRRFKRKLTIDQKALKTIHLIEAPTDWNSKYLPEGYVEGLREKHPERWVQRFINGSWENFVGQVYEEFSDDLHVIAPFKIPDHWPRTIGWDHGTTQSPTAVSFMATDEEGYTVIYDEYHKLSPVISDHAKAVHERCKGHSVPRGGEDGTGIQVFMDYQAKGQTDREGRNFFQLYVELGIIPVAANKHLQAGIAKFAMGLHPDNSRPFPKWHPRGEKRDQKTNKIVKQAEYGSPQVFIFRTCKVNIHQIQIYHYPDKPLKSRGEEVDARTEEPVHKDCDMNDATRYGFMEICRRAESLPPRQKKKDPFMGHIVKTMLEDSDAA